MASVRVLVADVYRENTEGLADVLRYFGCKVETAYDGFEAQTKAATFQPHVALIDMAIPGLTGLRVAKDMRADRAAANSLLIAMSGSVDARLRERARSAGFDRFLVKPCSIDEIREIIAPLCLVARHDEDEEKRTES